MYGKSFNYIYYEPKKIFIEKDIDSDSLTDGGEKENQNENINKGDEGALSSGIIALIIIMSLLFVSAITFIIIYNLRKKKKTNKDLLISKMINLVDFKFK